MRRYVLSLKSGILMALLAGVFASGCTQRQVAVQIPNYSPQYCYKTLAEVDCHKEPLQGEDNRRLDWYEEPKGTLAIERKVNCLSLPGVSNCPP